MSFLKDFSTLCSAVVIDYWLEFIMIQQISAVFTRLENQEGEVRLIAEVSQYFIEKASENTGVPCAMHKWKICHEIKYLAADLIIAVREHRH